VILKLKDVKPNPNRDLVRNPLDEAKVDELVSSIKDTGFWDNVVVRKNKDGDYECAYGHTRIAAAKKAGLTEADFIVKDFDDELMIKVMGRENSSAYKYSILCLLEKVRAVVLGLAEGRVKPFTIGKKVPKDAIRYAPSYLPGIASPSNLLGHEYTAVSVARFLGLSCDTSENESVSDNSVIAALGALQLMQLGQMKEKDIKDLNVDQLLKVVRDRKKSYEAIMAQEKLKAQAAKDAGKATKALIANLKSEEAERRKAEADFERELQASVKKDDEATKERKAQEHAAKLLKDAEVQKEREKRIKEYNADLARRKEEQEKAEKTIADAKKAKAAKEAKESAAPKPPPGFIAVLDAGLKTLDLLASNDNISALIEKLLKSRDLFTEGQSNSVRTKLEAAGKRLIAASKKF
jgi:hypothetical protein